MYYLLLLVQELLAIFKSIFWDLNGQGRTQSWQAWTSFTFLLVIKIVEFFNNIEFFLMNFSGNGQGRTQSWQVWTSFTFLLVIKIVEFFNNIEFFIMNFSLFRIFIFRNLFLLMSFFNSINVSLICFTIGSFIVWLLLYKSFAESNGVW